MRSAARAREADRPAEIGAAGVCWVVFVPLALLEGTAVLATDIGTTVRMGLLSVVLVGSTLALGLLLVLLRHTRRLGAALLVAALLGAGVHLAVLVAAFLLQAVLDPVNHLH